MSHSHSKCLKRKRDSSSSHTCTCRSPPRHDFPSHYTQCCTRMKRPLLQQNSSALGRCRPRKNQSSCSMYRPRRSGFRQWHCMLWMRMRRFLYYLDRSKNHIPWLLMSPGQWQTTVIQMSTRNSRRSRDHRRYAHRGPVEERIRHIVSSSVPSTKVTRQRRSQFVPRGRYYLQDRWRTQKAASSRLRSMGP